MLGLVNMRYRQPGVVGGYMLGKRGQRGENLGYI